MKPLGRTLGISLLLSALALAGAAPNAGAAKATVPTVDSLLGKQYESIKAKGNKSLKGRTLNLRFFMHADRRGEPVKPTMVFSGGCNAMGSDFTVNKGRLISRGSFTGTAMACKPAGPDAWLARNFRLGLKSRTTGQRLVLTRPGKKVKLVFRKVAEEAPVFNGKPATRDALHGKSFESTNVFGADIKKPIKISFRDGRVLSPDGSGGQTNGDIMTASLGCNAMGGEYQVDNGKLSWFDVVSTDMGCSYDRDGWFHGLLNKGVEARLEGPTLALTQGGTQIILKQVS